MSEIREAFQLNPDDFGPFTFVWDQWHEDIKRGIRELRMPKSQAVYECLIDYTSMKIDFMLSEHYFSTVDMQESGDHEDLVPFWLCSHDSDMEETILMAFRDHRTTYALTWGHFCTYWHNITSVTPDEAIVVPLDEEWVLASFHEEILFWGKPTRRAHGRKATTAYWVQT